MTQINGATKPVKIAVSNRAGIATQLTVTKVGSMNQIGGNAPIAEFATLPMINSIRNRGGATRPREVKMLIRLLWRLWPFIFCLIFWWVLFHFLFEAIGK